MILFFNFNLIKLKVFKGNNEGAPLVETEISLQFREMETITRERIFEGF